MKPCGVAGVAAAKMKKWKRYNARDWYQEENRFGDELLDPTDAQLGLTRICLLPACNKQNAFYQNEMVFY
jgi:hypothetical protein